MQSTRAASPADGLETKVGSPARCAIDMPSGAHILAQSEDGRPGEGAPADENPSETDFGPLRGRPTKGTPFLWKHTVVAGTGASRAV